MDPAVRGGFLLGDWAFSLPWSYSSEEAQPSCLQRTHCLRERPAFETVKLSMVQSSAVLEKVACQTRACSQPQKSEGFLRR